MFHTCIFLKTAKCEGGAKNRMGRACGMYGGKEVYTGFWWGNLRKTNNFKDLGIGGSY
jgi:hypothetical protein